jgi:hypothetical protein
MNNPKKPVVLPERVHPSDPRYTYGQYNPSQAAAYLHISRNVFYALVQADKIGREQVTPKRIVCSQRDLDLYAATRRHEIATIDALRLVSSEHDRASAPKSRYR